ncbi:sensor histidine kinase [Streptomyces sioyaensis]|uniref:sensor histidine kinase n=1 Tax=Streptomyces sioyaensis TaxID=67364 RepID=UPI003D761096
MGLRVKIGLVITAAAALAAAVTGAQVYGKLEDRFREVMTERLSYVQRAFENTGRLYFEAKVDARGLPAPLRYKLKEADQATYVEYRDGTAFVWAARTEGGKTLSMGPDPVPTVAGLDRALWQAGAFGTAVATLGGLALATRLGRRLRRSATSATRIADGDLDVRLPENGDDEIAQLTRAVNTMADALAARLEAESQVTANIAHELRTPVAGLVAAAGLLPSGKAEDMVKERAGRVRDLMEDVLEVARLDGGTERADTHTVQAGTLAQRAVRAATADRTADVSVRIIVDAWVETDPRRVERVLTNLVTNALRHGQEPVVVEVDGAQVAVSDHGPGFPDDLVAHGPQRFRTGAQGKGLGLGLTIAVGQAQVLGAHLTFTRAADGGARAVLDLTSAVRRPPESP